MPGLEYDTSNRDSVSLFAGLRKTGRSTWLLLALILMLVFFPALDQSVTGRVALGLLNTAILATAAHAASGSRRILFVALLFVVPALGLQWLYVIGRHDGVGHALLATMTAFYMFTIANSLLYVLRPGPVTGNKLHAAMAAFIMIGLLWSFIYALIDALLPGAFDDMGQSDVRVPLNSLDFLFFSFVTLTTTGYGDIVPVSRTAQAAAILEQLAGTFYVAILIARLAGLYEAGAASRSDR